MSLIANSERRCIFVENCQDIVVEALDIWKRRAKQGQVFIIADLLKADKDNLLSLWLADQVVAGLMKKRLQIKYWMLRKNT